MRKFHHHKGRNNFNTRRKSRQKQFKFYYTPFSQSARTRLVSKCVVEIIYVARAANNVFFVRAPVLFLVFFFGCGTKLSCVKYYSILCRANRAVYLSEETFLRFFAGVVQLSLKSSHCFWHKSIWLMASCTLMDSQLCFLRRGQCLSTCSLT